MTQLKKERPWWPSSRGFRTLGRSLSPGGRRAAAGAAGGTFLAALAVDAQAEDGRDEDAGPDGDHEKEEAGVGAAGAPDLLRGHVGGCR
jgi:hypothetical protein